MQTAARKHDNVLHRNTVFGLEEPRFTMAMQTKAIRFSPDEIECIQSYADLMGMSFSDVVRQSTLERIEDEIDIRAYEKALAEDDGTRLSMDEVFRMALATP